MGMTAAAGEAGTGRANVARWSSAVGEHHRGAVPRRKEATAMVKGMEPAGATLWGGLHHSGTVAIRGVAIYIT